MVEKCPTNSSLWSEKGRVAMETIRKHSQEVLQYLSKPHFALPLIALIAAGGAFVVDRYLQPTESTQPLIPTTPSCEGVLAKTENYNICLTGGGTITGASEGPTDNDFNHGDPPELSFYVIERESTSRFELKEEDLGFPADSGSQTSVGGFDEHGNVIGINCVFSNREGSPIATCTDGEITFYVTK